MPNQRPAFLQQHRPLGGLLSKGVFVATCFLWGGVVHAQRRVPTTAPEFYVAELALVAGQNVVLRTSSCTPASTDAVFYLISPSGIQVAFSDNDGGGTHPLINFTPSTTGTYTLIAVSASAATTGICTVARNNVTIDTDVPIGGQRVTAIDRLVGDTLITRFQPGGSERHAIVRFGASNVTGFAIANGIAGAAKLPVTTTGGSYLVGTPRFRTIGLSGPIPVFRPGAVDLLSNDSADSDGDGVGNALELELKLCGTSTCASAGEAGVPVANGRDTDRDGLEDGEELFGVLGSDPQGRDSLNLPRWGSDPGHKDVFIEVDSLNTYGGGVAQGVNPFAQLRAFPGTVGFWSGDATMTVESWVAEIQRRFIPASPMNHLKNPDGAQGIRLHFDLGVSPNDPADEANFGAYSTLSPRLIAADWSVTVTGASSAKIWVWVNGVWASPVITTSGLSPIQVATLIGSRAENNSGQPVRVKSVSSSGNAATVVVESQIAGGAFFSMTVATQGDPTSLPGADLTLTEESFDSYRAHYEGDATQVDPVRRGRFRYAVGHPPPAGQASGARLVTTLDPWTFAHELGHTLGLEHWGHSDWGTAGPDCLPHYRSRMNYTGNFDRFSELENSVAMNPASIREASTFGVGVSYPYTEFQFGPYFYDTSALWVDWNRNGFNDNVTQFAAPATSAFNASCSTYTQGRQSLSNESSVQGASDLVRFGNRLYAFWAVNGAIRYRFATLGSLSNKSCAGSSDPNNASSSCLTWSSTFNLASGGDYKSVTVAGFDNSIFVAFSDASWEMYARRYSVGSNGVLTNIGSWSFGQANSDEVTADPAELVELNFGSNPVLAVLYLSASGDFRERRWTGSAWLASAPIRNQSNNVIAGGRGPAAKGWPDALLGTPASQRKTFAIFPSPTGQMVLYERLSGANGLWVQRLAMVTSSGAPEVTSEKPFLEYRPIRRADGTLPLDTSGNQLFQGQFLIGWQHMEGGSPPRTTAMMRYSATYSLASLPGYGFSVINAGDWLQNVWAVQQTSSSAVLYTDSGVANVFGLTALDLDGPPPVRGVYFLPHADGAPNHIYAVRSDFRVMEDMTCGVLSPYRTNPVSCGAINVTD